MARGSYAKRLTGQISHSMPVLKPPSSLFQKWSTSLGAPMMETSSLIQPALGQAPETMDSASTSRVATQPEVRPFRSPEAQVLAPAPMQTTISLNKIGAEPRKQPVLPNFVAQTAAAESGSNNSPTIEAPKSGLTVPNIRPIHHRRKEQAVDNGRTSPAQPRSPAVSFSRAEKSQQPTEDTPATKLSAEQIDVLPRSEPRGTRESQTKTRIELQPRKDSANANSPAIPMRIESQIAERSTLPVVRRPMQQSQAQTAGGVHIGTVEVRITPPPSPAAPIARPVQARPSPAPALSRSFTSALGLTQGQ